jgi:hypothetical protein
MIQQHKVHGSAREQHADHTTFLRRAGRLAIDFALFACVLLVWPGLYLVLLTSGRKTAAKTEGL